MHRFFVEPSCINQDRVELGSPWAHQICHVLRLRSREYIVVLDNKGSEYEVELETVAAKVVSGRIVSQRVACGEPDARITLFQSMLKRDKFEWVLQKVTEVGVARIVPVVTERSLVRKGGSLKPDRFIRWRRILTEAAEQAHRGRVPVLNEPVSYSQALTMAAEGDRSLIACPRTEGPVLSAQLRNLPVKPTLALFIGPEGGFSHTELDTAQKAGCLPIHLGPRILRTETAATVAAALILYELGQLHPNKTES